MQILHNGLKLKISEQHKLLDNEVNYSISNH